LRGGHLNLGKWRRDESNPAGTSVAQIEATYAHLFGEHLERSRAALEAFDAAPRLQSAPPHG
jgi:hypothetical protein